ncbi:hypothetical protein Dimus_008751 [Dionaea muscipula]
MDHGCPTSIWGKGCKKQIASIFDPYSTVSGLPGIGGVGGEVSGGVAGKAGGGGGEVPAWCKGQGGGAGVDAMLHELAYDAEDKHRNLFSFATLKWFFGSEINSLTAKICKLSSRSGFSRIDERIQRAKGAVLRA